MKNFPNNEILYQELYRIRRFEEIVIDHFPEGVFFGTTHTYLGQEANAVGVLSNLDNNDIVFSNHRGHGHFLAYGGDMRALFAELMGRVTGVCGGRGGSQHLHWRNFYSNGIQGGIVPIATGMALAEKIKQTNSVTIAFMGDGTLGEGVIYESLNMASLWEIPIMYVLENNKIAQTTPIELAVAGSINSRFRAFDISVCELESSDVLEILHLAGELMERVRKTSSPHALIIHTCRFGPHSKGDDTRNPNVISNLRKYRDPIKIQGRRLSDNQKRSIQSNIDVEVESAFQKAKNDPLALRTTFK